MKDPINIFYADDDSDDRFIFESALSHLDVPVKCHIYINASSLEKALEEVQYACDVVFLDLNMPKKNGIETLASLQEVILNRHLKVVVFTTSASERTIKETFNLNAALFVQKPTDFRQLITMLQTIIDKLPSWEIPVPYHQYQYKL